MRKYEAKIYKIEDIDCELTVEEVSRKELLGYVDDMLENMKYDFENGTSDNVFFNYSDEMIAILYEDGTSEVIDDYFYIDHPLNYHVKRQHIVSIVFDNEETTMTYGPYEINEWGVVTTSKEMKIIDENNVKYLRSEF